MSRRGGHAAWEALLARALLAEDPVAALEATVHDAALPGDVRDAFRAALAHPEGLRMTALLVAKLRFERLLRGSPEAEAWFDRAPEAFTTAFRRYHVEVPPAAFFPREEGMAFARWMEREGSVLVG